MKKVVTGLSKVMIIFLTGILLFANAASAHVSVMPTISAPSAWETYTLKVPVEKDIPTTKVTVKVPDGAEFINYQPVPQWQVTLTKDSADKVITVTWAAIGEGISAGQFQQFTFVAKNPENETEIVWDAFQYYKDGSIVEWTGNEGSATPHSVTTVTADSTEAREDNQSGSHNDDESVESEHPTVTDVTENETKNTADINTSKEETDTSDNPSSQIAPFILSIAALILSITAILLAIRKKKK